MDFKYLYEIDYGKHFNKSLLSYALGLLKDFNTELDILSLEETNKRYRTNNKYNEYDYCYVLNMIYFTFYNPKFEFGIYEIMAQGFLSQREHIAYDYFTLLF